MTTMTTNTQYPGRPGYEGPDSGLGGLVHHDTRYEYCYSFNERLQYIDTAKPEGERAVRKHCLVRLDLVGIVPDAIHRQDTDLHLQADDLHLQADDLQRQADDRWSQADDLQLQANDLQRQADDLRRQANDLLEPYSAEIIAEVWRLVPDAPWDEKLGTLVFPPEVK